MVLQLPLSSQVHLPKIQMLHELRLLDTLRAFDLVIFVETPIELLVLVHQMLLCFLQPVLDNLLGILVH